MAKCNICKETMKIKKYHKNDDGTKNVVYYCEACNNYRCIKQRDSYRRRRYHSDPEFRERCLAYKRKKK